MTKEFKDLLFMLDQLKQAIEQSDWLAASELDARIKADLEQAIGNAHDQQDKQVLQALLLQVRQVYQLLVENSEAARKQISLELRRLSQDKKASDSYTKASRL